MVRAQTSKATIIVAPMTEPNPQAMPPKKLASKISLFLTPWLAVSFFVGAAMNLVYNFVDYFSSETRKYFARKYRNFLTLFEKYK